MKRFWRLTSVGMNYILKPDIDSEPLQYEMCQLSIPECIWKFPTNFTSFYLLELNFQPFVKLVYVKHWTGCF